MNKKTKHNIKSGLDLLICFLCGEKFHRKVGPAVEQDNGTKRWYLNDKRHREDGPAVEQASGTKLWYLNGKLHRKGGPAVEGADGYKQWWLKGVSYSEEEYWEKLNELSC